MWHVLKQGSHININLQLETQTVWSSQCHGKTSHQASALEFACASPWSHAKHQSDEAEEAYRLYILLHFIATLESDLAIMLWLAAVLDVWGTTFSFSPIWVSAVYKCMSTQYTHRLVTQNVDNACKAACRGLRVSNP